jgi:hypothetical protein
MDKKQVLIRVSSETSDRLKGLVDKYGMSVSSLVVSLINERWLSENSVVNQSDLAYLEKSKQEVLKKDDQFSALEIAQALKEEQEYEKRAGEIRAAVAAKNQNSGSSRKRHKSKL